MSVSVTYEDDDEQDWFADSVSRRKAFLRGCKIDPAAQAAITGDMAPRRYYRIETEGGHSYILQESAPDGHPQSLPGHYIRDYIRVQQKLTRQDVDVPEIIAADEAQGLVLLNDLGVDNYAVLLDRDAAEAKTLYMRGAQVLKDLRQLPEAVYTDLPEFDGSRIDEGMIRFVHWFVPFMKGERVTEADLAAFTGMKAEVFASLPPVKRGFIHGDFHPANLMPHGDTGCAMLDFQGAIKGPCVYDLVNLLDDARRDVPDEIKGEVKALYYEGLSDQDKQVEEMWYHALALHFHARVAGQFIKVAVTHNKTRYLDYLPRVMRYLQNSPVAAFHDYLEASGIVLDQNLLQQKLENFDSRAVQKIIRTDAI